MSGDTGAAPTPLVLDASVLTAIARGDTGVMTLIQGYDADGQPMTIPVLAIVAASLDMRSDDATDLLTGLEQLACATVALVQDTEQGVDLAAVIARTGLDPWDAQAAMIADAEICPILTLDAARWREHAHDLDEPLHIVEISDPDDGAS